MSAVASVEGLSALTIKIACQDDSFVVKPVQMSGEEFMEMSNVGCAFRRAVHAATRRNRIGPSMSTLANDGRRASLTFEIK